jgi:hypothetical protein
VVKWLVSFFVANIRAYVVRWDLELPR